MRRFARLRSRILAVSAATFIGALGAVALTAAPASAHTPELTSTSECVEGKPNTAKVTWTVTNKYDYAGTIDRVSYGGADVTIGEIKLSAPLTGAGSKLVGSMELDTTKEPKELKVNVKWADKTPTSKLDNTPVWPAGGCAPQDEKKPTYKAVSNCDGTLTVTIVNSSEKPRKFAVNGAGEWVERKDLEVGEEWVVVVPKEHASKVAIKWKESKDTDWEFDEKVNWAKPDTCFVVTSKSTCDGLEIVVENTGAKAIKATLTVGDQSAEKTIEPGKSEPASIEGVDGLVVKLSINGGTPQEFTWARPSDCGGAGGGLPTTGVNAGLLAGAALVLVSGGGGLFFAARRRRVRFAA